MKRFEPLLVRLYDFVGEESFEVSAEGWVSHEGKFERGVGGRWLNVLVCHDHLELVDGHGLVRFLN